MFQADVSRDIKKQLRRLLKMDMRSATMVTYMKIQPSIPQMNKLIGSIAPLRFIKRLLENHLDMVVIVTC